MEIFFIDDDERKLEENIIEYLTDVCLPVFLSTASRNLIHRVLDLFEEISRQLLSGQLNQCCVSNIT